MIDKEFLDDLAVALLKKDVSAQELGTILDNLVKWKRFARLPKFAARWIEKADDSLNVQLAVLLIDLRNNLVERGHLTLQ